MMAASAIFHSNAIDMYNEIRMTKTMSASTALWVIWLPHVGPTASTETAFTDE